MNATSLLRANREVLDRVFPEPVREPVLPSAAVRRVNGRYVRKVKPAIDCVAAASLLVVLAPVLASVVIAVYLKLGRPVLLRQERIGQHGRPFAMLKVRTMHPDRRFGRDRTGGAYSGPERRLTHKTIDDPRHTPLGRFLRRHSLDELPQLVNVVRGEMSLIGPRPELRAVADRHGLVSHPRHLLRPGLTGLWQISSSRHEAIRDGLALDEHYLATVGPLTDLRIAAATLRALRDNPGS
ncbi:MAG: sugar transferase [Acidimicrobiia bacterium]|nr:sugar transferase [Acidimicrobiia bacterium]